MRDCTLRIPGVCNYDPETTVYAHAPCVDKGWALKSPDWWGCYSCHRCHKYLDGEIFRDPEILKLPVKYHRVIRDGYFAPGIYETQKILRQEGLL